MLIRHNHTSVTPAKIFDHLLGAVVAESRNLGAPHGKVKHGKVVNQPGERVVGPGCRHQQPTTFSVACHGAHGVLPPNSLHQRPVQIQCRAAVLKRDGEVVPHVPLPLANRGQHRPRPNAVPRVHGHVDGRVERAAGARIRVERRNLDTEAATGREAAVGWVGRACGGKQAVTSGPVDVPLHRRLEPQCRRHRLCHVERVHDDMGPLHGRLKGVGGVVAVTRQCNAPAKHTRVPAARCHVGGEPARVVATRVLCLVVMPPSCLHRAVKPVDSVVHCHTHALVHRPVCDRVASAYIDGELLLNLHCALVQRRHLERVQAHGRERGGDARHDPAGQRGVLEAGAPDCSRGSRVLD